MFAHFLAFAAMQVPDYLTHVTKRLADEATRVVQCLNEPTRMPLIKAVEHELLQLDDIFAKGD